MFIVGTLWGSKYPEIFSSSEWAKFEAHSLFFKPLKLATCTRKAEARMKLAEWKGWLQTGRIAVPA